MPTNSPKPKRGYTQVDLTKAKSQKAAQKVAKARINYDAAYGDKITAGNDKSKIFGPINRIIANKEVGDASRGLDSAAATAAAAHQSYTQAVKNARTASGDNSNVHPDFGSVAGATHGPIGK